MNKTWIGCHETNYTKGRSKQINGIVIHWIAGTLSSCDNAFLTPNRQGSAHYGIGGNEVHQYVREEDTAWHAGNWDVNCRTIGIEHEGSPTIPISEETYRSSAELCREICNRYGIEPNEENITPHNRWAATQCPGTFDIQKLIKMIKGGNEMIGFDNNHVYNIFKNLFSKEHQRILGKPYNGEEDAQYALEQTQKGSVTAAPEQLDRYWAVQDIWIKQTECNKKINAKQTIIDDLTKEKNELDKLYNQALKTIEKLNKAKPNASTSCLSKFIDWIKNVYRSLANRK